MTSLLLRITPVLLLILGLAGTGCSDSISTCKGSKDCGTPLGDGGAAGDPNDDGKPNDNVEPGDGDGDGDGGNKEPTKECAKGSWDDDDDPGTKCAAWSVCAPGEYIKKSGARDRDQQCAVCEDGTFSDEENAEECAPFSVCASGIVSPGNITDDFECASPAVDVVVGNGFSCILREEGSVACWGKNDVGQLGSGKVMHSAFAVPVVVSSAGKLEPLSDVVQLSAGASFACAVKDDGSVWCWGANDSGQLGKSTETLASSFTALAVPKVTGAVKVAAAVGHACALLDDTTMKCWGGGAIGAGENNDELVSVVLDPDDQSRAFTKVIDIAVGYYHSCAVAEGGRAYCWGLEFYGEVGLGNFGGTYSVPTFSSSLVDVERVFAGDYVTCWQHKNGRVSCHGAGPFGDALGEERTPVVMTLRKVTEEEAAPQIEDIRLDSSARCMLFDDGTVWCWGRNDYGQLGNDSTESSNTLTQVDGLSDIVAIDAGYSHVCAVDANGRVSCWGYNVTGELGNRTIFESGVAISVPNVKGAVAIESGTYHTCAVLDTGRLQCWGSNVYGQLGIGNDELMSPPVELPGISAVKQFVSEGYTSLAVKTDGTIRGWGGELGENNKRPTEIVELSDVATLALGTGFACAVNDSASLKCWGSNSYGQSGIDNGGDEVAEPTLVAQNVDSIAAGMTHTCSLSRGDVKCWGINMYSQVGRPSDETTSQFVPWLVPGLSDASAISLGRYFSLALSDSGQVMAFGLNESGQLGDGEPLTGARSERATAGAVAGINDAVGIGAGELHACAVLEGGTVSCWGWNEAGQLGNGDRGAPTAQAQQVLGLSDAVAISGGYAHTCALHGDGTVSCWGSNEFYQLGHARIDRSLVPREVIWQ